MMQLDKLHSGILEGIYTPVKGFNVRNIVGAKLFLGHTQHPPGFLNLSN
jgi:hypothetical protein